MNTCLKKSLVRCYARLIADLYRQQERMMYNKRIIHRIDMEINSYKDEIIRISML